MIVARAFPSPSTSWKYADRPFDPIESDHATHVAGIAAGDHGTRAVGLDGTVLVSGIAPDAYLGNYKALTVPTKDWGLDGNSPELAKAIDQAVADGMNVINLALGEPAVPPSRDIVVQALQNAAAAGVVSVVAGGNDYNVAGYGSIGSPANAPAAISVAASTVSGSERAGRRRVVLVGGAGADLAPAQAGRDGPRRLRRSRRCRRPAGSLGTGRAWRPRTSRARRRCSCSGIRVGRWSR